MWRPYRDAEQFESASGTPQLPCKFYINDRERTHDPGSCGICFVTHERLEPEKDW